jgi:hypothetical protein
MMRVERKHTKVSSEAQPMEPLTLDEVRRRIGRAVYVRPLQGGALSDGACYPAIVFAWRAKDPYVSSEPLTDLLPNKLTVVQPAGIACYTVYWYEEDYGKTWLAYAYRRTKSVRRKET